MDNIQPHMEKNIGNMFFMLFGMRIENTGKARLSELVRVCSNKAYLDLCRTINYNSTDMGFRKNMKEKITELLSSEVEILLGKNPVDFTEWHENLCKSIVQNSECADTQFLHIGQAQKWINMTLKYLRMMGYEFGELEKYMHIPVDNFIIEAAKEPKEKPLIDGMEVSGLGILYDCKHPWSRCDDYQAYRDFQEEVMNKTGNTQLDWEEKAWIAMAIRHASERRN